MTERPALDEDTREALRGHLVAKALAAREKHGPTIDAAALRGLLEDREAVRFPTALSFDAAPLAPGQPARAVPRGDRPTAGFTLHVHPHFEGRPAALPELVAHQLAAINYLDAAGPAEADLFGAALLGLEVEDYAARVRAWADQVPRQPGLPGPHPTSPQPG